MATVGQIAVSEGQGKNIASYTFTDSDSISKQLQRIVLSSSLGIEYAVGNELPVTQNTLLAGEEPAWNDLIMREKCLPINVAGFYNNAIWIQGRRKLVGINVNKAGSSGVLIKVYDDYYNRPPTAIKATYDATIVKDYNWHGAVFSTGVYVIIADPGGGTAPDVTFLVA